MWTVLHTYPVLHPCLPFLGCPRRRVSPGAMAVFLPRCIPSWASAGVVGSLPTISSAHGAHGAAVSVATTSLHGRCPACRLADCLAVRKGSPTIGRPVWPGREQVGPAGTVHAANLSPGGMRRTRQKVSWPRLRMDVCTPTACGRGPIWPQRSHRGCRGRRLGGGLEVNAVSHSHPLGVLGWACTVYAALRNFTIRKEGCLW